MIIIENVFKYGSPIYAEVVYGTTSAGGGSGVWGSITGTITNQTDLVAYVNNRVPYTGATSDVNLGEFGLLTGNIEFDNTPTNVPTAAGSLYWDNNVGVLNSILLGGNVNAKLGVDNYVRVVNKVGSNLTKAGYRALKITTPQGQRLAVNLAQGNNDANSAETIGINAEDIGNNQEGFIITFGEITNINTTGSLFGETWADGDVLYLSPTTAGYLTKVKPLGQHIVVMGYVEYAHQNNGKIFVKVMNGLELEELHDVNISSPTNGQVLTYNLATDKWINASIPTVNTLYTADGTLSSNRTITLNSNNLNFVQSSLSRFYISAADGRVGIGTSTPLNRFEINNGGTMTYNGNDFAFRNANAETAFNNTSTTVRMLTQRAITLAPGNSDQHIFTSSGLVGFGTITPAYSLDLVGTGQTTFRINGSGAGYTHSAILLQSSTTNFPERRGLGIYTFNDGGDETWYFGNGYNINSPDFADNFVINRKSGVSFDVSTAAPLESSNFFTINNVGSIGVGQFTPNISSILDIVSTTKGVLFPRMTSTQRGAITTPATGLFIYNTTGNTFDYYNGTSWLSLSTGGGVSDGDKGDITVSASGATWTIDNTAVTYAKIQNVAANSFLANVTGSSATVQEIATNRIPLFASAITGTPSASTFLRGDGSWATVSGSGITSLNGLTATTQTFANDTNVTITSATSTHTLGWSGQLSIARGGTGQSTASAAYDALNPMTTLGDMIYEGTGPTAVRLPGNTTTTKQFLTQTGTGTVSAAPTWGTILGADVPNFTSTLSGTVPASGGGTTNFLRADGTWAAPSGGGGGITTLNTLTAATQTFAVGTSGTDFNISSATSTHTFNIPDASNTAGSRGLIIQGAQTLGGQKIFRGSGTGTGTASITCQNSSGTAALTVRDDLVLLINGGITSANTIAMSASASTAFTLTRSGNLGSGNTMVSSTTGGVATSGSGDQTLISFTGTINNTSTNTSTFRSIFLNHNFTSVTGSYRGLDIVAPATATGGGTITYIIARTSTATIFQVNPTTITIGDAVDIVLNTTTGTKFGTSTSQKIGFYNATPIVQPTTATAAATFVANTGTAVNDASTFDGYTLGSAIKALRNLGILA